MARRESGGDQAQTLLARWPVLLPRDWAARVNAPQTDAELEAVRRGSLFGELAWQLRHHETARLGVHAAPA